MKYAILGIGQVGLRHFNAFKRIKNLSLIGFIEKNSKKANSFEKKFKIKQYKNLNKLLILNPDFVIICLPHNQRVKPIITCINNNVNLLIEKPLTKNINELKKILPYIQKKNKLIHTISFVHRYRKEVLQTSQLIQKNKIGKIRFISEIMISQKNPLLPRWIDNKNISGGGVLMYNAVHSIDKLIFITKSKIIKVFATYNNINNGIAVEDTITAIITFKNGVVANLLAVFAPYKNNSIWETKIFGEKGCIDLKIREGLEIHTNSNSKIYIYLDHYNKFGTYHHFYLQAKSYIAALSKKNKPFVNISDGIDNVKIVDAIYKSIQLKKSINVI